MSSDFQDGPMNEILLSRAGISVLFLAQAIGDVSATTFAVPATAAASSTAARTTAALTKAITTALL